MGILIAPVARVESSKHVLVTEDDDSIRELLEEALTDANYTVSTANNGAVAMQLMHERVPDLLILDLRMPDITGWELLRRMEQSPELSTVPVLVVSATGVSGLSEAQDLGAPVFLPKPFDIDELLFEVERLTTRPIRQCAWCGQVATSKGKFDLHSGRILPWATHGVCPQCKRHQMQQMLQQSA